MFLHLLYKYYRIIKTFILNFQGFKLTSATTSQVGLITASNKDALSTGKNACLAAVGNDIFLDF